MATRKLRRSPSGSNVSFDDEPLVPLEWERLLTVTAGGSGILLTTTNEEIGESAFDPFAVAPDSVLEIDARLAVSFTSGTVPAGMTVGGSVEVLDVEGNVINGLGFVLPRTSAVGAADTPYNAGSLLGWSFVQRINVGATPPAQVGSFRVLMSASEADAAWLRGLLSFKLTRKS